eukprot:gene6087-10095_t
MFKTVNELFTVSASTFFDKSNVLLSLSSEKFKKIQKEQSEKKKHQELSKEEAQTIFKKLPDFQITSKNENSFTQRDDSIKRPEKGQIELAKFPAKPKEKLQAPMRPTEGGEELLILNHTPDGEQVKDVTFITVIFNQPMVPIATLEFIRKKKNPLKISPKLEGEIKWITPKILKFTPHEIRKATTYQVTIPKGIKSELEMELQKMYHFSFSTASPKCIDIFPSGISVSAKPIFFLKFDQEIDVENLLEHVRLVDGGLVRLTHYSLSMLTRDQVKLMYIDNQYKNIQENIKFLLEDPKSHDGVWFTVDSELPAGYPFELQILPGIQSMEGVLCSTESKSAQFRTYTEFTIAESYTAPGRVSIQLTRPIDESIFEKNMISISPRIDVQISYENYSLWLNISGKFLVGTEYKIDFSSKLIDIYGSTMKKREYYFTPTDSNSTEFIAAEGKMIHDASTGPPTYQIWTKKVSKIKCSVYHADVTKYSKLSELSFLDLSKSTLDEHLSNLGTHVVDLTLNVQKSKIGYDETTIELQKYLQHKNENLGQLIVVVEPNFWFPSQYRKIVWIQSTCISLDQIYYNGIIHAWSTNLKDGSLIETDFEYDKIYSTKEGYVSFSADKEKKIIISRRKNDCSVVLTKYNQKRKYGLHVVVIDEKALYLPNEKVNIKGYLRNIVKKGSSFSVEYPKVNCLICEAFDSQRNSFYESKLEIAENGSFNFELSLPDNLNLGDCFLKLSDGKDFIETHSFCVQEFRKPEFTASTEIAPKLYLINEKAQMKIKANYFSGGPMSLCAVNCATTVTPTIYKPNGWISYTFNDIISQTQDFGYYPLSLNDSGEGYVGISLKSLKDAPIMPFHVNTTASVYDINNQLVNSSSSIIFHPAEVYVGLKMKSRVISCDQVCDVDLIVANINGIAVSNVKVDLELVEISYKHKKEVEKSIQKFEKDSTSKPINFQCQLEHSGNYKIKASVQDKKGNKNCTSVTFYVDSNNNDNVFEPAPEILMIANKEEYVIDETAEIYLQSPFKKSHVQLLVLGDDVIKSETLTLDSPSYLLKIKITKEMIPNFAVVVSIFENSEKKKTMFASLNLKVLPVESHLHVSINQDNNQLKPGEETIIEVEVLDYQKKSVEGADVLLMIVDDAVLHLGNYKLKNPLDHFLSRSIKASQRSSREFIDFIDSSSSIQLKESLQNFNNRRHIYSKKRQSGGFPFFGTSISKEVSFEEFDDHDSEHEHMTVGGLLTEKQEKTEKLEVRTNFYPVAAFEASTFTDKEGKVKVKIKLPDTLTRYRIMAVASFKECYFGTTESNFTVSLPFMIRPMLPRFLNVGDENVQIPVVVENQSDEDIEIDLAARSFNLDFEKEIGYNLKIKKDSRDVVCFTVKPCKHGIAKMQFGAILKGGIYSDAVEKQFKVLTPATSESFAIYGEIDDDNIVIQPIQPPETDEVFKETGGLEISTSSTAAQTLTDAVISLDESDWNFTESECSSILGILALKDVISLYKIKSLPSEKDIDSFINKKIKNICKYQNLSGGWSFLPNYLNSGINDPFVSCFAGYTLFFCKKSGYSVDDDVISRSFQYLNNFDSCSTKNFSSIFISFFNPKIINTLTAFAQYALTFHEKCDKSDLLKKSHNLFKKCDTKNILMEGLSFLLYTLDYCDPKDKLIPTIHAYLMKSVNETGKSARFVEKVESNGFLILQSNIRTDAIIMNTLISVDPTNYLIPKIAQGLLERRIGGKWNSSQENCFILTSMKKYLDTYEKEIPNFKTNVWFGDSYGGSLEFKNKSLDSKQLLIPMEDLLKENSSNLTLEKKGIGRLYYRLVMSYSPLNLNLKPCDFGFLIERKYYNQNKKEIIKDKKGRYHFNIGETINIRISIVTDSLKYHVALIDKIPGGFEPFNPFLERKGSIHSFSKWFQYQNIRDERVEVFTDCLWPGIKELNYCGNCTIKGDYIVLPCVAKEMYTPEIFGRSSTDYVIIE